ncbi:hypothetical protein B0H16DRAFT_1689882 [Mycena metata]|uniref:Uncharacterized protein n=1 Tax=Mycena metata TaxID=1033252 RepID=A0AAD7J8E6_9AGAR|nr:hypothetical protein B0H16DRAFT_1689882 [Mycena metata]
MTLGRGVRHTARHSLRITQKADVITIVPQDKGVTPLPSFLSLVGMGRGGYCSAKGCIGLNNAKSGCAAPNTASKYLISAVPTARRFRGQLLAYLRRVGLSSRIHVVRSSRISTTKDSMLKLGPGVRYTARPSGMCIYY